jgi:hypothetical protein
MGPTMSGEDTAGWDCVNCGDVNADDDTSCRSCGFPRSDSGLIARPFIDEAHELHEDGDLLPLVAGATLFVLVVTAVVVAVVRSGGCGPPPPICYQNFDNWLNSPQGWLFYALLAVVVPTQVAVIVCVVVLRRRRGSHRAGTRIGLGRALGIVGGVITLIGVFLPWATIFQSSPAGGPPIADERAGSIAVFVFGILGLEFVAIPTKGTAAMGLGWGVLSLSGTLYAIPGLSSGGISGAGWSFQTTIDYGLYVTILGCLVLIIGSALAHEEARKAEILN